jgi:hypothetical protein
MKRAIRFHDRYPCGNIDRHRRRKTEFSTTAIWNDVHQVIYVQDQIEISVLEKLIIYYYREE